MAVALLGALSSCQKQPTNADGTSGDHQTPGGNLPPVTHLFLLPDSAGLDTSASVLNVHWWGQDPDGWVIGYFVSWDYFAGESDLRDSIWLTSEAETFYLPLDSAFDVFSILVKAVDNAAIWNWPENAKICAALGGDGLVTAGILNYVEYEAFLDNGSQPDVYDPGDSLLWAGNMEGIQTQLGAPLEAVESIHLLPPTDAEGAMDLNGASLIFPVRNTPPEVSFRIESNPNLQIGQTYKTYPTRSFFWDMTDLDGEITIDSCFYALDPESGDTSWAGIAGNQNSVTLTDLNPSLHRFFLKIQDIAGAQSPTIRFPANDSSYWEVLEPVGDLLIVDDYNLDASNAVLNFYGSIFDTLTGVAGQYSVWEMGADLPYSSGDVLATLNYFDKVLWYSFYGISHYTQSMNAIAGFLEGGGGMLITALQVDTSSGVLPISVYEPALLRVGPPNGFTPVDSTQWPLLTLSEFFSNEIFGLEAGEFGEVIYEVGPGAQWSGRPGVCVRRTDAWDLIFFGVPLHLLNGSGTLPGFLGKVFNEEFGN